MGGWVVFRRKGAGFNAEYINKQRSYYKNKDAYNNKVSKIKERVKRRIENLITKHIEQLQKELVILKKM